MTLGIAEMTVGGTMYKVLYHIMTVLPQGFTDYLTDETMKKQRLTKAKAE